MAKILSIAERAYHGTVEEQDDHHPVDEPHSQEGRG